jgi:hypothetical protein
MLTLSVASAALVVLGHVLHVTAHADEPASGPFSPSPWVYFVPAHATHVPATLMSGVLCAVVESSLALTVLCALVLLSAGAQLERACGGGDATAAGSDHARAVPPAAARLFATVFALAHGTFVATSFLASAASAALAPRASPAVSDTQLRSPIGHAFFGPLAFSAGVAVAAWSRAPDLTTSVLSGGGGPHPSAPSPGVGGGEAAEAAPRSWLPAGIAASLPPPVAAVADELAALQQLRFAPFLLVCAALAYDVLAGAAPPTQSEMLLGIATRGPLLLGVAAAAWVTWAYFRFLERRTELAAGAVATAVTRYGNPAGRFALHLGCPVRPLADGVLLPFGDVLFSRALRVVTSHGDGIDAGWAAFVASGASRSGESGGNGASAADAARIFEWNALGGASRSGAAATAATALPPLPGSTAVDADRRRELALLALQQRLNASSAAPPPTPNHVVAAAASVTAARPPLTIDAVAAQTAASGAGERASLYISTPEVDASSLRELAPDTPALRAGRERSDA